ncbi:MAG: 16S rRNA (guanine(527)-N(7))-methyltransferase RsmG [Lachnospiraceae bacterium]|nr:16S rRNA (guanine(527)-N(7))-methyltransferase RsmG [Lachnospiraceae bacterium]
MSNYNFDAIIAYCNDKGIELKEEQLSMLSSFYEMLVEKNKVMNLTGITEWDDVVLRHYIDSISISEIMNLNDFRGKVLDLGTGAGFPGIPLKIIFPNLQITLFDSLNKRIRFLQEVIDELKLKNIETIHGRAEEFGKNSDYREQYDLVVSRAVANIATLSEYCLPFVKVGGSFISYKTDSIEEEISNSGKAVSILGGKIERVEHFTLPNTDMERSLLQIKKIKTTGKKFPRKAGLPSKEPLH